MGATLAINELRSALNIVWGVRGDVPGGESILGGVRSLVSDGLLAVLSVMALGGLLMCAVRFSSAMAFVGSCLPLCR